MQTELTENLIIFQNAGVFISFNELFNLYKAFWRIQIALKLNTSDKEYIELRVEASPWKSRNKTVEF